MGGFAVMAPEVQDALAEVIAEEIAGTGVPSCVGYPAGGPAEEQVWMEGGFELAFVRRTSGGTSRTEVAALTVKVLITRTADEVAELRDRALVLVAHIEDAVRDHETLTGLVERLWVESTKANEGVLEDGRRQFGATVTVRYEVTVSRSA